MSAKIIAVAVIAVVAINVITTARRRAKHQRDVETTLKNASNAFRQAQARQQSEAMSDHGEFMRQAGFGGFGQQF